MPVINPKTDLEAAIKLMAFKIKQLEKRIEDLEKNTPPHLRQMERRTR
jgi:hypothetical protein